ncbi:MAG: DNA mismatch repair endonuclease MutL [Fimbriimonadaceae bacterium]
MAAISVFGSDSGPAKPTDGRVRLLDPHSINQIAAGEVVERPASVVKELVENALDAGATRIEVELRESGKALIRISDDGCGMSAQDARACLQRHATSKIQSVDDLATVSSLGFRGEAIPSIASVSRFSLSTGVVDGQRTNLSLEGGEIVQECSASGPKGTDITVEDLFYNTPARLKFLKSPNSELSAILEHLSRYGIAFPQVAFRVTHNDQMAMQTTGSGDLFQAISEVWGRDLGKGLCEADFTLGSLSVKGFVSPPYLTKPTRSHQYLYVNGRPVRSRMLMAAVDQAYRDLTPEKRHAVLCLFLEIDPERVDINVSPTKNEVKFQSEGLVFDAIRSAIRGALLEHGMMPSANAIALANEALSNTSGSLVSFSPESLVGHPLFAPDQPLADLPLTTPTGVPIPSPEFLFSSTNRYPFMELLEGLHVIGQAMNTFMIAETARGIVIIDQHVAHERVLYEYLCGLKGPSAIETQALLVPETLHLDRASALMLSERIAEIEAVGFGAEPFGGESFVVRSVPAAIRGKNAMRILRDMVDELVEGSVSRKLTPSREQIWITSACKMAVKAGDPLSNAEMEKLIVDLATTENPYLCPHGRPITITLGRDELLKKFYRK